MLFTKIIEEMIYDNSNKTLSAIKPHKTSDYGQFKYENIFNPTQDILVAKAQKQLRIKKQLDMLNNKKNLNSYEQDLKKKLESPIIKKIRKQHNCNKIRKAQLDRIKEKIKEQEEKGITTDLSKVKTN